MFLYRLQNNESYDQARSADAVAETEFTLPLFNKGTLCSEYGVEWSDVVLCEYFLTWSPGRFYLGARAARPQHAAGFVFLYELVMPASC